MKKHTMFKYATIAAVVLCIILTPFTSFANECGHIRQKVLRLHVLANSDTPQDQQLKLDVRDAILRQTEGLFNTSSDLQHAIGAAESHLQEIEEIAATEIQRQGYNYPVKAEICNMYFTTRTYNDCITLPAGDYNALRITIGHAQGQNWWCVMFPPLCLPAASSNKKLEDVLTPNEVEITENKPKYEVKFAFVELFEGIKDKISQLFS